MSRAVIRPSIDNQVLGMTVRSMWVSHVGDDGLVPHTLGHFLAPEEGWAQLPPYKATSPTEGLRALEVEYGFDVDDFVACWRLRRRELPRRWWERPALQSVLELHDRGYWPRIVRLIKRAGRPDTPGAGWHRPKGRSRKINLRGYMVIAEWSQGSELLRVVSAYRDVVINDLDTAPSIPGATIGAANPDLFDKLRASLPQDPLAEEPV